ncbi:MAG: thrombospondin type 3 repeat-containing protein [Proteobacteria bacterium]|nr:thrombospondin type 3 repeat-containing protein [Pseudomonadota bacterium]
MRRGIIVATLGALGACSTWIGLDRTELSLDRDGDGVIDIDDNCPETPNADQANQDGDELRDAIDDACDRCPGARDQDDEDGDGIPDGCDVCPAIADPDQTDTLGDGTGDACSDVVAYPDLVQTRRYFDGFDLPHDYAWHPAGASQAWETSAGTMRAPQPTPTPTDAHPTTAMELYAVRLVAALPREWVVATTFDRPVALADDAIGVRLFDDSFGSWACLLQHDAAGWSVRAEIQTTNMAPTVNVTAFPGEPPAKLTLRVFNELVPTGMIPVHGFECEIAGVVAKGGLERTGSAQGIRLETTSAATFYYLDVYSKQP